MFLYSDGEMVVAEDEKKKKSKDAPARSAGDDFLHGENRKFLSKGICR